ncbi:DMT family transporter [uncultured Ferrimonas sp.]|uniref:DMT family transporter n=1 Tax=uncultured Ferrimonas sp. TaxID=432640 RepID=UPI00263640E6|nr:DMT family transporter [uncultured Ferrimonas sp.]
MTSAPRAHLYLLIYAVLISTSYPLANFLGQSYPPLLTTLLRYLIAAVGFILLLLMRGQLNPIRLEAFGRYSVISLPLIAFFLLMFVAADSASAIAMSSLSTTVPLFSVLFAYLGWRQPSSLSRVLVLLGGGAGALWLISQGQLNHLLQGGWPLGNSQFLLGCAFMGLYPLLVKQLHRGEPMLVITGWSLICGCLWLLLVCAVVQPHWLWPSASQTVAIVWLATANTMLTFFLFQSASVVVGGSSASAYALLSPAIVIVINVLLGQPWPAPSVLLGLIPIFATLLWLLKQDQQA